MADKPTNGKSKGGRPSKYDPAFCDQLEKHMAQGFSIESFAGKIGVSRDTLYAWSKVHPEFSDTIKRGTDQSLFFWEKLGLMGVLGKQKGFNATMWIFNMKNRFKWRDYWDEPADQNQGDALKNAIAAIRSENKAPSKPAKKKGKKV